MLLNTIGGIEDVDSSSRRLWLKKTCTQPPKRSNFKEMLLLRKKNFLIPKSSQTSLFYSYVSQSRTGRIFLCLKNRIMFFEFILSLFYAKTLRYIEPHWTELKAKYIWLLFIQYLFWRHLFPSYSLKIVAVHYSEKVWVKVYSL